MTSQVSVQVSTGATSGASKSSLRTFVSYGLPLIFGTLLVFAFVLYGHKLLSEIIPIAPLVSLASAVILAGLPLFACSVQTISVNRESVKLDSVIIDEIKQAIYFQLAKANLTAIQPASISSDDYRSPMTVFSTVITFFSLLVFMGLFWPDYFQKPILLLGGMYIIDPQVVEIVAYQSGTLVICGVAFLGAYIALFHRMLNQLNNNDIYPISFYYYSAWLIAATIIAAIFRHTMVIFGLGETASISIILIAFAIGAAPSPFFSFILHWAFSKLHITGDKDDPDRNSLPSNLNLLMIDGLENEVIDRLSQLNVTNAQVLSCQNPFVLWTRLPYDLALIIDWISQAQLYVCVREDAFKKARAQQINDIHKFVTVLQDEKAAADLCDELGFKPTFAAGLLKSLNENPCFVRLRQVKIAMLGKGQPALAIN